jgi:hypothetical protein
MTRRKNRYKTLDHFLKINDEQLKTPEHDDILIWLLKKDNLKKIITEKDPEALNWDWENVKIHAEEYIIAENGYRVGPPDITFSIPHFVCKECSTTHNNEDYCPTCNDGELRLMKPPKQRRHYYRYFVEIKPEIDNFGVTLRQLKLYISYGFEGRAYLITEDLRYKEEFESQGIRVINPIKPLI